MMSLRAEKDVDFIAAPGKFIHSIICKDFKATNKGDVGSLSI